MDGSGFAGRVEAIEQPCGRRSWPAETKPLVVAESHVPGASVGEVARRHGVAARPGDDVAAARPAGGAGAAGQPAAAAGRGCAGAGCEDAVHPGGRA